MAKKAKKKVAKPDKQLHLPNDPLVKINMPFEKALQIALNTPIENSEVKSPKEESNLFHNIMKASVANNPKPKPVKPPKKK